MPWFSKTIRWAPTTAAHAQIRRSLRDLELMGTRLFIGAAMRIKVWQTFLAEDNDGEYGCNTLSNERFRPRQATRICSRNSILLQSRPHFKTGGKSEAK